MVEVVQLFQSVLSNDKESFENLFQSEPELDFGQRNQDGRTILDLAVILGRREMVELLLRKDNTINTDGSGYSPLHLSAMWGQLSCLKLLVNQGGGDYQSVTRHNEDVKKLAERYNNMDCVRFIESAEARVQLKNCISSARETLSNSERIAGKWNKDDKTKVTSLCNEKTDWLEWNPDVQSADTNHQIDDFNTRYEPHLAKLDI